MTTKKVDRKLKEAIHRAHDIVEQTNDLPQAIEYLESFSSEFPNSEILLEELGALYYENSDLGKALSALERVYQKNKTLKTRNLLSLANLYNDQRSLPLYQKSIENLSAKIKDQFSQETNRTLSKAQLQILLLKQQLGFKEDYLTLLSQIHKKDPYFLDIFFLVFLYYLNLEDQANALRTIQEFIQQIKHLQDKNPEELLLYDKDFYLQFVDILLEGNYFHECLSILNVVQEVICRDLHVLYLQAFCFYHLQQQENLQEMLQEIKEFAKENPEQNPELLEAVKELQSSLN